MQIHHASECCCEAHSICYCTIARESNQFISLRDIVKETGKGKDKILLLAKFSYHKILSADEIYFHFREAAFGSLRNIYNLFI